MTKKPFGWRREPARHSLASKGIESAQRKPASQRVLQPLKVQQNHPAGISPQLKDEAVNAVLQGALDESSGDKEQASALIRDDSWFYKQVKAVARDHAEGPQAAGLERAIKEAFGDTSKEE